MRARRAAPCRRRCQNGELLALIDEIRGAHEFAATNGSPRVWLQLRRRGVRVGRKRIERIMHANGRRGAYRAGARGQRSGGRTIQDPLVQRTRSPTAGMVPGHRRAPRRSAGLTRSRADRLNSDPTPAKRPDRHSPRAQAHNRQPPDAEPGGPAYTAGRAAEVTMSSFVLSTIALSSPRSRSGTPNFARVR